VSAAIEDRGCGQMAAVHRMSVAVAVGATAAHSEAVDVVWSAGLLTVAVAALGILATALFRLDGKIESGFGRLDTKIDGLAARTDARFDRMDARFDRVDERLSTMEVGLAQHLEQHR
jgi:hypothetical protein